MKKFRYEIYDPDVYRDGIPYQTYARLREEMPVSWHEEPPLPTSPAGPGFWAVMLHEDVQYVSRMTTLYSASLGTTMLRDPKPEDLPYFRSMLLNMDPPVHNHYRRIISRTFSKSRLTKFDSFVETRVCELMAPLRGRSECDIVTEVTDELALSTLAFLLGVPRGDRRFFFDWANRIIGNHDAEYSDVSDPASALADLRSPSELTDLFDYAESLAEFRRRNPGDDLITELVQSRVDGRGLTTAEFQNFFFLLAIAGNDTTRSALPGALLALMDHPEQFDMLRDHSELVGSAIEECLRFAPPVIHFRRTATQDTVLHDVSIRTGQKVVVFYPSANRDPRAFARPDVFDIRRKERSHVTFGYGPHVCVAAGLARIQMRHFLTAATRQMSQPRLSGQVDRLRSNYMTGFKHVPLTYTPVVP
ncbi:MAG TPA: cytochrome P450 [Streptosporangiaceae bacterium]|nr:cytochrome P450 [Streptosporangiaceae bacterium]